MCSRSMAISVVTVQRFTTAICVIVVVVTILILIIISISVCIQLP